MNLGHAVRSATARAFCVGLNWAATGEGFFASSHRRSWAGEAHFAAADQTSGIWHLSSLARALRTRIGQHGIAGWPRADSTGHVLTTKESKMHDIDRTLTELEMEYEGDFDDGAEFEDEFESDAGDVFGEFEMDGEFEFETDDGEAGLLSDEEEMELASDLLNVSSEEELELFLGNVFRKVRRGVRRVSRAGRRFFKSGVGRRLGGVLKGLARRALPVAGRAIGGVFGGPAGAAIGGRLAPMAGRIFGLELEGLSPEDQEFETARRFVRLAASAAANAARGSQTSADPQRIVRSAIVSAARRHAPGLLTAGSAASGVRRTGANSGRWVRRGNTIVLTGV